MTDHDRRILAAIAAVKMHQVVNDDSKSEPTEETLTDLLTDLRHWAKEQDVSFDICLRTSNEHFKYEQRDEQGNGAHSERSASARKQRH